MLADSLKLRMGAQAKAASERMGHVREDWEPARPGWPRPEVPEAPEIYDTTRRLRPLARRRLSTSRPFLWLIRSRNPCVRRRRRRFG
jgi:hypothetical protein